jgi:hypothetical protein
MSDRALRDQLVILLAGGEAHGKVAQAVREFPAEMAGGRIGTIGHTPWRLLEHMRIAQWDILEFSRNPHHVSPDFPDGYWPREDEPPHPDAWDQSVAMFCSDLQAMQELVADSEQDLFAPIPHGQGQTLLREAMLVADHNAYHLGQLWAIRRSLEA